MIININNQDFQWILRVFLSGIANDKHGGNKYTSPAHSLTIELLAQSDLTDIERKTLEIELINIQRRSNGLTDISELSKYHTIS